ncbi:MAG: hypothetical protein AVDCRST_MAG66-2631, partial [uncultured Pseudonocardia sp.]
CSRGSRGTSPPGCATRGGRACGRSASTAAGCGCAWRSATPTTTCGWPGSGRSAPPTSCTSSSTGWSAARCAARP